MVLCTQFFIQSFKVIAIYWKYLSFSKNNQGCSFNYTPPWLLTFLQKSNYSIKNQ